MTRIFFHKALLFVGALLATSAALADVPASPEFTGKVVDADTGRPIGGALVVGSVGGDGSSLEHGSPTLFEYVNRRKIPAIFSSTRVAEAGGLMSLQEDSNEQIRRSAEMVVKILKGSKPEDMAINQADKFELVINMKVARQSGFTIPQSVLLRADRVID